MWRICSFWTADRKERRRLVGESRKTVAARIRRMKRETDEAWLFRVARLEGGQHLRLVKSVSLSSRSELIVEALGSEEEDVTGLMEIEKRLSNDDVDFALCAPRQAIDRV